MKNIAVTQPPLHQKGSTVTDRRYSARQKTKGLGEVGRFQLQPNGPLALAAVFVNVPVRNG